MGRFSLRKYICSPLWAIQPGLRPSQPGLRLRQPARPQASGTRPGWMAQRGIGRTDVVKISTFYRTSSPIGATALLPKGRPRPITRNRADHLMPLSNWFIVKGNFYVPIKKVGVLSTPRHIRHIPWALCSKTIFKNILRA